MHACPLDDLWFGSDTGHELYWYMRTLVPEADISAWISNCVPQNTVGCNYLALPEIPASGAKVFICNQHVNA